MRTRRRLLAFFVVLLVAAAGAFELVALGRRSDSVPRPERPFVALEAIAASHRGWEIVAPPRLPGPYRQSAAGGSLLAGGSSGTAMTGRVRNEAGTVIEEIRLESDPTFDQLIVHLDTASGDRTLVVMRRPR